MGVQLPLFALMGVLVTSSLRSEPTDSPEHSKKTLAHISELQRWFAAVGERRPAESFGMLVARIARLRLGFPYDPAPPEENPEHLRLELDRLHCVSLIEYSDAIARCVWLGQADASCFEREVETTRYRDGKRDGYASRLHYFSDWLGDNQRRQRLSTPALPLTHERRPFFFMTRHPRRYPQLKTPQVLSEIRGIEERLSQSVVAFVARGDLPEALDLLRDGDVVAVVTGTPGIVVSHTGLILLDGRGAPRLLHASERNGRVVLSRGDLADYVLRRPERLGVIVARPEAPRSH